ncbi:site-specific integrase [Haladaptatus sp. DJG-WS-42]|uniref:tyrosine-type recombinase/integrase n=1 Tax=Haladaptatus sp. DJG-WS-42 TaxID=3120516 RepID=UPI0030CBB12C
MTLEPIAPERALELYLDHRRNEVAVQTLQSHRSRLRYFVGWCHDQNIENLNNLTGRTLYEYRIWRRNDGDLSKVSEKTQMVTIRVFIKFLESIDAVDPDLHTKVQLPILSASDAVRTEMLDAERAEQVLTYLEMYRYASVRHVILTLAWRTAMRRGAMYALDVHDYDSEEQYIQTVHRKDTGIPLNNQESGERYVALSDEMCELLDDWLADQRPDVTDDAGREPLLASKQGRLHHSTIQHIIYEVTRPCFYTDGCPHDRDVETCEATNRNSVSRCPSSRSPHVRRGAITYWLSEDVPERVVSDRANVSPDVIEKHYDQRGERDKMEQRRGFLDNI